MDTFKTRKEIYEEYLATPHWAQLRQETFKAHGHCCAACGRFATVQAHHLRYRDNLTDCTPEDMMPLCDSCHTKLHTIPFIIPSTMQRETRREMVDFVLDSLWNSFRIGSPRRKKHKSKKARREQARKRRLLFNPGRPLSVRRKHWVSYSDVKGAQDPVQIWELPVRNRSTGFIAPKNAHRKKA